MGFYRLLHALIGLVALAMMGAFVVPMTANATQNPATLTIERIFSAPALTTAAPQQIKFAPSGHQISYLKGSADAPNVQDLWLYDVRQDTHTLIVAARSEEHTSELQSRENLVCRLLLEKKKQTMT